MSIVWSKVWRDLVHNKVRTILVVISTAVGVFALGLVLGLFGVINARMTEVHQATIPAHITFWGGPFSRETVGAVRREPGVIDVEGEMAVSFNWKMEGEANGRSSEWRDGDLIARDDYSAQGMNLLFLLDGRWPERRTLAVERQSARYFDIPAGSTILAEFGHREQRLAVEGVVRAHAVFPPPEWGGDATFFVTPEAAAWLAGGGEGYFNRLYVRLESYSEEAAVESAKRIEDRLERMGLSVGGYEISDPNVHWMQDMIDAISLVLIAMGAFSLGLSAFLIINTMMSIIAQQVWQIGVMKTVGATIVRVVDVYLATALIYGVLALLLAVPPGVIGAHLMAIFLLDMINIAHDAFRIVPTAVGLQVVLGVAVPLLAALVPVLSGAATTVREAISSHGIGSDFGQGRLDRLIAHVRGLPRPVALSMRNTFRRKARISLTLVTLTLSGAMFAMVMSVMDSFDKTIAIAFGLGEDVAVSFERPRRISRLVEIAESVPGVIRAEAWGSYGALLSLVNGENLPVSLDGVPSGSAIFDPVVVEGRSLHPGDDRVVLVTTSLARGEGIEVGDEVTLSIGEEEATWTVVGLHLNINTNHCLVPLDALGRETGTLGRGMEVKVLAERNDLESQRRLIEAMSDAYAMQRIEVDGSWSTSEQWEESESSFGLLIQLLLAMAVLAAVVGSTGLMSTMSVNVVERRREIGVMRAIGGRSLAIGGMFVAEGVFVGVLSWLLAAPLSYPGARLLSSVLGEALFELPLEFVYSMDGVFLWLLIVIALSALASLWPALRATRVSVREALAYE